ncbi:MAG: bifunctional 5,10-methylenetetrahydrofolate dehydrogenase/5,10-methenyltetrahydrofolate cyclohydrolase [Bdellovibrionota bacterium]
MILSGQPVVDARKQKLLTRAENFQRTRNRPARLDVVLVGEDPASKVYVGRKQKMATELGMKSNIHNITLDELKAAGDISAQQKLVATLLTSLNANPEVDGILLQLPLPKGINEDALIDLIEPLKDVDGLGTWSVGELMKNSAKVYSCTPWGILQLLKHYEIPLKGKKAVIIGRSLIVGKPMAQILLNEDMSVFQVHSKSENIEEITRQGDVVVVAAGREQMFGKKYFGPNAVVIDVGIHRRADGKIVGDVNFEEVKDHVRGITPVPGGVGPLTIISLMENTLQLAELRGNQG